MKEFWNERYSSEIFVYGKKPNDFFSDRISELAPGRLLLPGEGEGRNAVHAASLGWEVDAFDQSMSGLRKAEKLAGEKGVRIRYKVSAVENFKFPESYYDAAGLVFLHLMPEERRRLHKSIVSSLRPGGTMILEAFHISQVHNISGGPKNPDMLYDREILLNDFDGLEPIILEEKRIFINEGPFHQGEADVIRYSGRKL